VGIAAASERTKGILDLCTDLVDGKEEERENESTRRCQPA
jgi:hypothetical protein